MPFEAMIAEQYEAGSVEGLRELLAIADEELGDDEVRDHILGLIAELEA